MYVPEVGPGVSVGPTLVKSHVNRTHKADEVGIGDCVYRTDTTGGPNGDVHRFSVEGRQMKSRVSTGVC